MIASAFALGFYSAQTQNRLYHIIAGVQEDVDDTISEAPNLLKPIHFLQPARYPGSGVTVNKTNNQGFVLLSGFFKDGNELRLIRRNGEIVARWPVSFSALFPDTSHLENPPVTDWNIDLHGARILPDGAVVFNFEYGGMVKLDRCGHVVWTVNRPTHHAIEIAEDGGYWVPGRRYHEPGTSDEFPPFSPPYSEDTLLKVSAHGHIESELSVPGLFYANDLESVLTSTGESIHPRDKWDEELVHLNQVSELKSVISEDFPMFDTGDLLLSFRELNLLMVVAPDSRKIKWWKIGPWVRQHDPEFIPGGKIVLFNNNIYRSAFGSSWGVSNINIPRVSNILWYNIDSDTSGILFGGTTGQELLSVERGKVQRTANDGYLITEFEGGRVLEIDRTGEIVWEYINRYDNNLVAEISESYWYSTDYFELSNWECSQLN